MDGKEMRVKLRFAKPLDISTQEVRLDYS